MRLFSALLSRIGTFFASPCSANETLFLQKVESFWIQRLQYTMSSLLLEIGVEELPAFAVLPALHQLKTALLARMEAERLPVAEASITTFATPRRLTLRINDVLPSHQTDTTVETRGPSTKAAFDANGAPTKALQGFAAKQGIPVESIVAEGEYVVARRIETGRSASAVLTQIVPEIVRSLTFPKFLRWGAGNFRFGRPLRRIVALLDDDIVPIEMEGIQAGRETVGHRYTRDAVVISRPETYEAQLRDAFVEPDSEIRRAHIVAEAHRLAASVHGVAVLPENLITENVFLTEWTTGVLGSFDAGYLILPRAVLTTSMAKNQRFFPIEDANGSLLPHFIAIRNGDGEHLETVRKGYEGVLASRFNDALFFFENDRKSTLADKAEKTTRIVFQEKLGTLADKARRVNQIMERSGLFTWTGDAANAQRAVQLAKADLSSEIVMELTSLQGTMGREFAYLENEPDAVAVALAEQYLPKSAGDSLPESRIGTALSLADRVDTLMGYMLFVGAEPKGSSDPFGLKRAANAVIDLLARDADLPSVRILFEAAHAAYESQGIAPAAKSGDLRGLMETRLRSLLEEREIRLDVVEAVFASEKPYENVFGFIERALQIQDRVITRNDTTVAQPANRVRNILRSLKATDDSITPSDFVYTQGVERTLSEATDRIYEIAQRQMESKQWSEAMDTLASLQTPVNAFFDGVMVLDSNDSAARNRRIALLRKVDGLYLQIADFSRITAE